MQQHAINWFEIPVSDFARAKKFYESVFNYQMPESIMGEVRMGFFIYDFQNGGRGGAIVHNTALHKPSKNGTLVYLNCDPDLMVVLDRVEPSGGRVVTPKTIVAENLGFWALIEDTEGNHVALHSMQ